MLIALTTGQRCQTKTFFDISERYMKKHENCFEFALSEHIKQGRPGKVFGNVKLYKYPIKELCIYETLEFYLKETEYLRSTTRLLVSFIKPYNAVTSSTIGRWIKTVLDSADIDTSVFLAHSTRCASASKVIATISADMLIQTDGWSEEEGRWSNSRARGANRNERALKIAFSKYLLSSFPIMYCLYF